MPERPFLSESVTASAPIPIGERMPKPVITTLLNDIYYSVCFYSNDALTRQFSKQIVTCYRASVFDISCANIFKISQSKSIFCVPNSHNVSSFARLCQIEPMTVFLMDDLLFL